MYEYENFVLPYINGKYKINGQGELIGQCPFHEDTRPSFTMNLETGLFNCFACGEQGNIVTFIAKMENISNKEAYKLIHEGDFNSSSYKIEDFAREKHLNIEHLKLLGISNGYNCIQIPYYDEQWNIIGTRLRFNPGVTGKEKNNSKFSWKKGSKMNLYGLNGLKDIISNDYIVLVEGESDTITLWNYGIPCVGVPGVNNLKKSFVKPLERFKKIYIHNEGDLGGQRFVENACKVFSFEKLYTVSSKEVHPQCKDPSDLHIADIFDKDKFLATATKIDKNFYDEVNCKKNTELLKNKEEEELEEHVKIAEEIMTSINIKYYAENFYVYENGVYKQNELAVERKILEIKRNAKKNLRKEILDYIRIYTKVEFLDINEQFINFKNGMYDLINKRLIPHSPKYFTTCQINANYISPLELKENMDIESFLKDITCNDPKRRQTLFQISGYCMTFRTDLQLAFFLYGPSAGNGKSTFINLLNTMIGKENVCHVTMQQLCERFKTADITDKLLNTETEVEKGAIRSIEMFKKVVSGDELSVEQKYKNPTTIHPFCKLIYATNNLPKLQNIDDEGYYRRIFVIPFNRKFTKEEECNFNPQQILTTEALDYFANKSLQAYLEIINSRTLINTEESNSIINKYRQANNSVKVFLDDEIIINEIFYNGNIVSKTVMYAKYIGWCQERNFFIKTKGEFYEEVESRQEYIQIKGFGGKDCFKNINKPDKIIKPMIF